MTALPTIADIQAERARRSSARDDFEQFIRSTFPNYRPKEFHLHVARRLQAWANFEIRHLIVVQPPRTGKSEHATRRLPAWLFGRNPTESILMTAHTQPLANRFSGDIRRIIRQHQYRSIFPSTRLPEAGSKSDARALKADWETTALGRLRAAGVGVGIVGDGYRRVVVDDCFRNMEEAHSLAARDRVWNWYANDVRTRLEYPFSELLVNTRWHKDDLIGRLIREEGTVDEGGKWEVVRLPFLQDVDDAPDYDPRDRGEALWPEWFQAPWEHLPWEPPPDVSHMPEVERPTQVTLEELEERAQKYFDEYKGDRDAVLQGNPVPEGGNILKEAWMQHWSRLPGGDVEWLIFCDPKGGSKDPASSRAVVQLWCRDRQRPADIYLVAQAKGLWDLPETIEAFRTLCAVAPWSWAKEKLAENKADGKGIVATLKSEIPGLREYKLPGISKPVRYRAASPFWKAGNVYLPPVEMCVDPLSGENWWSDFKQEHTDAPAGLHDDQIDTTTMAILYLLQNDDEEDAEDTWREWTPFLNTRG